MPCALAAILLPESVAAARLPYAENNVFQASPACIRRRAPSGRAWMRGAQVRRGWAAGVGATTWVQGGGAWHRGGAASVGLVPFTVTW